jgi:phage terminase small subunit
VGHLQSPYIPLLHLFAQAGEMAQEAREAMRGKALIREGRSGGVNPYFRVWKDAAGTARALGEQLGASPVAMARLGLSHVRGMSMAQELQAR